MIPLLLTAIGAYLIGDSQRASQTFADGGEIKLLAPNGKPSNLTPEQWHIVRTPEFKAWFGDWENDAANASKIVDENGEPLIVYHRSKKKFNLFDVDKQLNGWLGKGFYFSGSKLEFKDYGRTLLSVFLNIKNPFIVKGESPTDFLYEVMKSIDNNTSTFNTTLTLKENNYDGVIYKHWDYESKMFSCFESNQIKLADGTNTTFDGSNPDIRFAKGGKMDKEITCINCKWQWNTKDSEAWDMYVCHKCGFNNRAFYDSDPIGNSYANGGKVNTETELNENAKSLRQVNKYIDKVYKGVILVKGEGYFYIASDIEEIADKIASLYTTSIPVYSIKEQTVQAWIDDVGHLLKRSDYN